MRGGPLPSFYRVEEIVREYEGNPLQHPDQQLLHTAPGRKYFCLVRKYLTRTSGFSPMRVSAWPKRGPVAVNRDLGWNIWYQYLWVSSEWRKVTQSCHCNKKITTFYMVWKYSGCFKYFLDFVSHLHHLVMKLKLIVWRGHPMVTPAVDQYLSTLTLPLAGARARHEPRVWGPGRVWRGGGRWVRRPWWPGLQWAAGQLATLYTGAIPGHRA